MISACRLIISRTSSTFSPVRAEISTQMVFATPVFRGDLTFLHLGLYPIHIRSLGIDLIDGHDDGVAGIFGKF